MKNSFYYISNGKMHRFDDGKTTEISSGVLESYISKVRSSAERNEWKYNGSGAAFTGSAVARASAQDAVSSIFSRVSCVGEHNGCLIYSIDIDNTNGIYRKLPDTDGEGIVLCSSSNAYRDFDIKGNLLVTSSCFAGESHIGILDLDTNRFDLYTEGHARDTAPVWSAVHGGKIYFCSAGLPENNQNDRERESAPRGISQMVNEMYASSSAAMCGPSALCVLDVAEGRLDELLSDNRYDYTHPQSTSDGSLYYIRKPYKSGNDDNRSLGCLADLVMMPFRLIGALFSFLNVFSAKYSGKTLSRSDVKSRDEKQMFIDGNLINAERELKENQRRGDKNPGIIPRSWELRRLDREGNDTLVRCGVAAYRVDEESGDILISNGSHILRIDENGKEEKLLSAEGVTFIK